jgi:hypothetical protein
LAEHLHHPLAEHLRHPLAEHLRHRLVESPGQGSQTTQLGGEPPFPFQLISILIQM